MEKFILSQIIKETVLEKGRVVIPGFGTFSTEPVPATFSTDGRILNPPTRIIKFTSNSLASGDELLNLFSSKLEEYPEIVRSRMDDIINGITEDMDTQQTVVFPGFGTLSRSEEEFTFHPQDGKDIFLERVSMEPVLLRIIDRESDEPEAIPEPKQEPEQEPEAALLTEDGQETAGEPEATTGPEQKPEQASLTEDESEPEPEPEPEQEQAPEPKPTGGTTKKRPFRWSTILIATLTILFIVVLFLILGRNGAFDSLLYSEEELQLIESLK